MAGRIVDQLDPDTATYTRYGPDGTVIEVRPFRPEETAHFTAETLRGRAAAAIATNTADQAQAETIRAQAATLAATTTTFTTAQLSGHVRSLATAVQLLAAHDIDTKKQLNVLIRLVVEQLDSTDGT